MTTALTPQSVDLTSPDTFVEGAPHDYYRFMRAEHPIWYQNVGAGHGYYHLFRYDDVIRVSRDPETFISSQGFTMGAEPENDVERPLGLLLIEQDPPRHQKLRSLINKAFTPRKVRALEPHIREIAREIVNDVCEKGEADFVEDVAAKLPLAVICEMLAVPREDWDQMFDASNRAIGNADPEYAGGSGEDGDPASMMFLFGYFQKIMAEKKARPGEDLVSTLLAAEIDGERLSDEEILRFCFLLVIAGNETTRNATSHGTLALAQHPAEREKLIRDRTLIPSAVEEIVRWGSPVMHFIRTAVRDTEVGGQQIRAGDRVAMWYPSANRDESHFDDPYTFDVTRKPNDHVGFGHGEHFCLGASLARLELRVIFEELVDRLPDIEVTSEPSRLRSTLISGIKHMPVRFTPSAHR